MQPHLRLAQELWKKHLNKADIAIDATCGNGYDTLYLSHLCHVIALDIQPVALENTHKLLEKEGKKADLHLLSHEKIDEIPRASPPRLIVYNLGYLPRGNKTITTMSETTLISVKKSLEIIEETGALSITCYPGHEEGKKECEILLKWITNLSSSDWLVCHHQWINRKEAPSLIWITRK